MAAAAGGACLLDAFTIAKTAAAGAMTIVMGCVTDRNDRSQPGARRRAESVWIAEIEDMARAARRLLVLSVSLLLSGVARASPEPPLRLPQFPTGEVLRFESTTTTRNTSRGPTPLDGARRITFEVRVLSSNRDGARISWVLRDGAGSGEENPPVAATWLSSLKGVPVEIDVDPAGVPLRIANWGAVRGLIFPRSNLPPGNDPAQVEEASMGQFLIYGLTSDLVTMAAMQDRGSLKPGNNPLPTVDLPERGQDGGSGHLQAMPSMHVDREIDLDAIDRSRCVAHLRRSTVQTMTIDGSAQPPQKLETDATVSTKDGWVIGLRETLSMPNFLRTIVIKRQTRAPCAP